MLASTLWSYTILRDAITPLRLLLLSIVFLKASSSGPEPSSILIDLPVPNNTQSAFFLVLLLLIELRITLEDTGFLSIVNSEKSNSFLVTLISLLRVSLNLSRASSTVSSTSLSPTVNSSWPLSSSLIRSSMSEISPLISCSIGFSTELISSCFGSETCCTGCGAGSSSSFSSKSKSSFGVS